MAHIHWYPGHIAKAERELKEKLKLIDVIIEVIDARIPNSSRYKTTDKLCPNKPRIILMNKSDVSDEKLNNIWKTALEKETKCKIIITNLLNKNDIKTIINNIQALSSDIMEKRAQKGLLPRATRVMVIGMPNVGKSSTINRLIKRAKTKTGPKAGVTKIQQWVRINDKVELLDTPGIIPTVQDDQFQALKLACVNSIGENAFDSEEVAQELLKILDKKYKNIIRDYFTISEYENLTIENVAIKRNWLLKNSTPDTKRASQIFLSMFREGKIGKFTLETPEEYGFI